MDIHIIDDDRATRLFYSKIARSFGFSSASFDSAENYLSSMLRDGFEPPFLVLSDVEMPGIDGYQLLHEIRKHSPNQCVVITSGIPSSENGADIACLYFIKPVSINKLESLFDSIDQCTECGHHPDDCSSRRACSPDDRLLFGINGLECQRQKSLKPARIIYPSL